MSLPPPSPRFYRRFCVYGRSPKNLIASVALRAANPTEPGALVLDEVWTHRAHRGKGLARGLLRLALESAILPCWDVYCYPVAHDGGPGPNQPELEAFYAAEGFEAAPAPAPAGWLVWRPPF